MNDCISRFQAIRRKTRTVQIGHLEIGGNAPIRIQSMITTNPQDVSASVAQCLKLADAGCEITRIAAPNLAAAQALKSIRTALDQAGCSTPLVADIHFLPQAAMEAALHVEKVRINPGNYADKKKFAKRDYTDSDYKEELDRLYEAFTPLVLRCKELGRALRIGTNHGSLSDRILNRYGDTPLGMVESALEFIRIAESHGFYDLVLSMKASNPKVMIEAYRLAAAKMQEESMAYPLHLGVTEAGDGEDGRIKSAIGIGTLLADGLGDTIRVSLTEDPVYEVPIAQALAKRASTLWGRAYEKNLHNKADSIDPFSYQRRNSLEWELGQNIALGKDQPIRVFLELPDALERPTEAAKQIFEFHAQNKEQRVEGLILSFREKGELKNIHLLLKLLHQLVPCIFLHIQNQELLDLIIAIERPKGSCLGWVIDPSIVEAESLLEKSLPWEDKVFLKVTPSYIEENASLLKTHEKRIAFSLGMPDPSMHAIGAYRALAESLKSSKLNSPIWIESTATTAILPNEKDKTSCLLESSILLGSLLCDGIGDVVSVPLEEDPKTALSLSYNILQGTRNRFSKTEFVACPSCGRTLFNLEDTTKKVREQTQHLKGLTIAIMGCIVNGPGEMADADFGYVGGAPGKINLYVKKDCVEYNIPEAQAVERLIALIKKHGRWVDPL